LGKWIFWGVTGDVPENLVQSEIVSMDEFFRINACDYSRLLKHTQIVYEVDKVTTELNRLILEEKIKRQQAQARSDGLCNKLEEKTEALEMLTESFERETEKAYRWQMCCIAIIAACVMFAVGSRVLL
jgi:hypothetical protein